MVTIDDFNQQRPIDTAELTFDNANKNNDHCLFLDIVILNGQLKTKKQMTKQMIFHFLLLIISFQFEMLPLHDLIV